MTLGSVYLENHKTFHMFVSKDTFSTLIQFPSFKFS